jgi:two-component system cell cycle sensor histidine kinase/response regulator CckA
MLSCLKPLNADEIKSAQKKLIASSAPHILILNSYHKSFRWTDDIVESAVGTIKDAYPTAELYIEYMDTKRNYSEEYLENLRQNYQLKYADKIIDVIILSDDNALIFMQQYHDEIFSQVPVVFCGINDIKNAQTLSKEYFVGIIETQDIRSNIELITTVLPATETVAFVTDGTPTGLGARKEVVEAQAEFSDLDFIYLNGEELTTDELLEYLRELDLHSAVLAPAWYRDKDNVYFNNSEIYPLLTQNSPVPVFTPSAANMGLGPIGGKVNSGTVQGKLAAQYALSIFNGSLSLSEFTLNMKGENAYMFDSKQLSRFGIDELLLPAGSIVINRPFSFYKRYRRLVNITVAVFVLFSFLIIVLIIINGRLRTTRRVLAVNEKRYRAVVEDTPLLICRYLPTGKIEFVNRAFCRCLNKSTHELIGSDYRDLIPYKDRETTFDQITNLPENSPLYSHETGISCEDGTLNWYRWTDHAIFNEDGEIAIIQSIGENITEYKDIQKELTGYLKEKEILLQEVHHRVKNNMQVIIALLHLQMLNGGSELVGVLTDISNRMQIFADIHASLYRHNDFSQIDFKNHLEVNFYNLCKTFQKNPGVITISIDMEHPALNLDMAIPCGLLMNELMSNSFKHAIDREGEIKIVINRDEEGRICYIDFSDSGIVNGDIKPGFGTTIIEALSGQLKLAHEVFSEGSMHHVFKSEYHL